MGGTAEEHLWDGDGDGDGDGDRGDPAVPGAFAASRHRDEDANRRMTAWLLEQERRVQALVGESITRWDGVEMAIREASPSGPVFVEPSLPFLQLSWLRLTAATEHTVAGYQDDGYFGLCLVDRGAPAPEDAEGIYRWREPPLPVGRVDAVRVVFEEGELSRITLTIDGQPLLLVAGEVDEGSGGRLHVRRLDESVLVFLDPADADRVVWV